MIKISIKSSENIWNKVLHTQIIMITFNNFEMGSDYVKKKNVGILMVTDSWSFLLLTTTSHYWPRELATFSNE